MEKKALNQVDDEGNQGGDDIDSVRHSRVLNDGRGPDLVADEAQSCIGSDPGQGLADLAEEGIDRVARPLFPMARQLLLVVDGVGDHGPDFKREEGNAEAGGKEDDQEDVRIRRMDDEARQVGSRRDIGPDGTELLLAELLDELRREGHQDDQGQVVCNHDHGLQLGRPEIVLEEVAVHRLPVHIGHDENH